MSAPPPESASAPLEDGPSDVDDLLKDVDDVHKEDKKAKKAKKEENKLFEKLAKDAEKQPEFTPEEIAKRQELVLKLCAMGSHPRFEEWFKKNDFALDGKALKGKTIQELEELMIRAKQTMRMKTRPVWLQDAALSGIGMAEHVSMTYPVLKNKFDVTGLSAELSVSEEFKDIMAELELDYTSISTMSPEKMLLMTIGKAAMAVNARNQVVKFQKAYMEARMQPQPAPEVSAANPPPTEPSSEATSSSTDWNLKAPPPPAPSTAAASSSTSSPPLFQAPSSFKK
jgi:hypothetical protein